MAATRLQTTDRADKRDLILRAAALHFNEYGFNDARLEDIASSLGTGKTSISYHFKTKHALLEAAYRETCALHSSLLDDAKTGPDALTRIEAWIVGLGRVHSQVLAGRMGHLAFLNDVSALDPLASDDIARLSGEHFTTIEQFLEGGVADGSVSTSSVRSAAFFLWNVANWIERWLGRIPSHRHEAAVQGLASAVRRGLSPGEDLAFRSGGQRVVADPSSALFDREARARLKKDAFERAGIRSFNRQGYSSISLNALASGLGASRGSFYYSFADKDELLESCVTRSLGQFTGALDHADGEAGSALAKLYGVCTELYSGHFSDLDPLIRPCLFASLSAPRQAVADAEVQNIGARFARLVAQCLNDGSGQTGQIEKLGELLLATIDSIATGRRILLAGDEGHVVHPVAHEFFGPLFRGLRS